MLTRDLVHTWNPVAAVFEFKAHALMECVLPL